MRNGSLDDIQKLMAQLGQETKNLVQSCLELSWYSRGGWPYETVLQMSAGERDVAAEFISKRLETQSKSMYPIY